MKTILRPLGWLLLPALVQLQPAAAQGIITTSGTQLVAEGQVYLVVNNGGFTNNGTFLNGNSTFVFTGNCSTASSFIGGTNSPSFYNLTLNKTAQGMQLNRDISVSNTLLMQSGDSLFLNNFIVNLGTTGSLSGETETRRFTGLQGGYIAVTRTLNAPNAENPGNIGATITSSVNMGPTLIKRYQTIQKGKSASRMYEIIPTVNNALNASVAFDYLHAEMNSISEGMLTTWASLTGTTWNIMPTLNLNTTVNTITIQNLSSLEKFTLFAADATLPVHLLYFNGSMIGGNTILNWSTAIESDNLLFEIERSANGLTFSNIGTVTGAGNSVQQQHYAFTDIKTPSGYSYYRLRQVDANGKFSYSNVLKMVKKEEALSFSIAPNPTFNYINLQLYADAATVQEITIIDRSGNTVYRQSVGLHKGNNTVSMNISRLQNGYYFINTGLSKYKPLPFMKN